jgi:hypothetical protein
MLCISIKFEIEETLVNGNIKSMKVMENKVIKISFDII